MATDPLESTRLRGLFQLPADAYLIEDVDEEVFLQYTNLAGQTSADGTEAFRGLGHLDSHKDTLTISFELGGPDSGIDNGTTGNRSRGANRKHSRVQNTAGTLDVELFQDKTALRTRKGDTGSVVWRASVDFVRKILQQHRSRDVHALLNPLLLPDAHILELGAGTGLLGIVFASMVARYTATDIDALIPLIKKNFEHNLPRIPPKPSGATARRSPKPTPTVTGHPRAIVTAEALDWTAVYAAPPGIRRAICSGFAPVDVLLIVDCMYHPSLLPSLLATIDALTAPERTAVLVVVELRAEDVVREFLDLWLHLGKNGAQSWEVWSVPGVMERPYAVWVGWKTDGAKEAGTI